MTRAHLRPLLAVLLLATACGGGTSSAARNAPAPTATPGPTEDSSGQKVNDGGTKDATGLTSVDVSAKNFVFTPAIIIAKPGQVLKLVVHNTSTTLHNVSQPSQHVNSDLAPGATSTVTLTVPASGRLVFTCKYHASRGMAGTVGSAGATTQSPSSNDGYYHG